MSIYNGADLGALLVVPKTIYNKLLADTTSGTTIQSVRTVPIVGGALGADGDVLHVRMLVQNEANANTKGVRLDFAGVQINAGSAAVNGGLWDFEVWIEWVSATQWRAIYRHDTWGVATYPLILATQTATLANSQDLVVKLTTPTQAGDATLRRLIVVKYPAVA